MEGYKTKKRRKKKKPQVRSYVTIVDHDEQIRAAYSSKAKENEDDIGEEYAPVIVDMAEEEPVKRPSSFHDVEDSPPRRGDLSPPRRRRHDSPHSGDISPPIRRRYNAPSDDLSSARRGTHSSNGGDLSPPRRHSRRNSPPSRRLRHSSSPTGGISPPRRRTRHDSPPQIRHDSPSPDISPPRRGRRHDSPPAKARHDSPPSVSHNSPVRKRGRLRQDTPPRNPLGESEEQHWGPKSLRDHNPVTSLDPSAPFARTVDDAHLNDMYRSQDRWGDPMARFIAEGGRSGKNSKKRKKEKSGRRVSKFRGPPNRFNIPPGPHWDGVNRSNGFENEFFAEQNRRRANESDRYKWSVSDM